MSFGFLVEEVQVEIRSEKPKEKRRSDSTSKSSSKPQSSASSKFNRKRKKHRRTSRSDSESSSAGSGEESASTEPPVKVSKEPIEEGDHNSGDHNEQNGNLVSMEGSEVGVEMTQVAEQPQFRTESLKRVSISNENSYN